MPTMTTCYRCGYHGPHGFTDPWAGFLHIYHDGCPGYYHGKIGEYLDPIEGFDRETAREGYDPDWVKGMRYRLLGKPRLSAKYFKIWNEKTLRRKGGQK